MKIKIINKILCLISPVTFVVPVAVSCSNTQQDNQEIIKQAEQYIYDRSFSILASSSMGPGLPEATCRGTAWIISDATPNINNDYSYFIATNWHVIAYQEELPTEYSKIKYSFADPKTSLSVTKYTEFVKYEKQPIENFMFKSDPNQSIDMFVVKADFSSATGTTKSKLDKINNFQNQHHYINKFAPSTTSNKHFEYNNMYVGGFPVNDQDMANWEFHRIGAKSMKYIDFGKFPHQIIENFVIDVAPLYQFTSPQPKTWMDGGASGSMLLEYENNEFGVAGIYWGGGYNESKPNDYYPCFDIFNSSQKNFVQQYL